MKILVFSDHFRPEPSAPAAHVYERCRLWVREGHKVTVITSAPNFPEGRVYPGYRNAWRTVESLDGIRVVRVKTFMARNEGFVLRTLDYLSYMVTAFLFGCWEETPDVVMSTSPHLFVPVSALAWAMLRRVPHVMEVRDLWPASLASTAALRPGAAYRCLEAVELVLYRRSTRIVALTHTIARDIARRGIRATKIDVVVNGANLDLFCPKVRDAELASSMGLSDRFVVGYLGTLGLAHGLENVIDTAELLRDTDITFMFVGVGAAKGSLTRAVEKRGLANVVFAPRQLKEDMPRFWSLCDLSLIHLKNDPLFAGAIPSKIFESMAMGIPIVYVGPESEGTAIVEQHSAGIAVPAGNPSALANALRLLRSSPQRMRELSEHSLTAAPLYSRERQAKDTLRSLRLAAR